MILSGTGIKTREQVIPMGNTNIQYTGLTLKDFKELDQESVTIEHAREALAILSAQCGIPRIREPYRHALACFIDKMDNKGFSTIEGVIRQNMENPL